MVDPFRAQFHLVDWEEQRVQVDPALRSSPTARGCVFVTSLSPW
jgi:hypothetical protein